MTEGEKYDERYFLRGKEAGVSLYENYRWLPELTLPMVNRIILHCGIKPTDDILDFGCARGYVVRAFRELGYNAFGVDVSKWAIDNADQSVKGYCSLNDWDWASFDWIIAKDVLEHVEDLKKTCDQLLERCIKGLFVVVPLSAMDGEPYVVPEYEKDVTHRHRLALLSWVSLFSRPGWAVDGRYRIKGVKDNYSQWAHGNGFLTIRKVEQ